MTETRRLEVILAALPDAIDWPEPSPQLSSRVTSRIESGDAAMPRRPFRWALALAIAAIVVLTFSVFPGARQAVADLFSEAGVRIGLIDETPSEPPGQVLDLGEPVSLSDASSRVGIELRSPLETLGPPDAIYVERDRFVSMFWGDSPVLLVQSPSDDIFAQKGVGPETLVTEVQVAGAPGLWIEGAEHTFSLLDEDGNPIDLTTRLAANVLLWTSGGVDHRLELTGDVDDALEIAESMKASE